MDPQGSSPPFGGLPSRAPQSRLYQGGFWMHKASRFYWFFERTFSEKVIQIFGTHFASYAVLKGLKRGTPFWTLFQKTEWYLRA